MHYCGVVPARGLLQLVMLEEVREAQPPIRLAAVFYEPGTAAQIARETQALGDVVVAIGAPLTSSAAPRACDQELRARGVAPVPEDAETLSLAEALDGLSRFEPRDLGTGLKQTLAAS